MHQFCSLGSYSFCAMGSAVSKMFLISSKILSNPAKPFGINVTGIKRLVILKRVLKI